MHVGTKQAAVLALMGLPFLREEGVVKDVCTK